MNLLNAEAAAFKLLLTEGFLCNRSVTKVNDFFCLEFAGFFQLLDGALSVKIKFSKINSFLFLHIIKNLPYKSLSRSTKAVNFNIVFTYKLTRLVLKVQKLQKPIEHWTESCHLHWGENNQRKQTFTILLLINCRNKKAKDCYVKGKFINLHWVMREYSFRTSWMLLRTFKYVSLNVKRWYSVIFPRPDTTCFRVDLCCIEKTKFFFIYTCRWLSKSASLSYWWQCEMAEKCLKMKQCQVACFALLSWKTWKFLCKFD